MDNSTKIACTQCGNEFDTAEAMRMHESAKHSAPEKHGRLPTLSPGKIRAIKYGILVLVLIAAGFWWASQPRYVDPPYKFTGQPHPETHPATNFVSEPISLPVQVHILEHAPNEIPGALAQYNCKREEKSCQKLVQDLQNLVAKIDSQKVVYVAPYYNTEAKIVLTGRGKIEKLNEYDETRIRLFFAGIGIS